MTGFPRVGPRWWNMLQMHDPRTERRLDMDTDKTVDCPEKSSH